MSASIDRRQFIAALPVLALAPRILAQTPAPAFRVNGLSQITLTVSDVARSLDFYQGLFGMPVQARQGSTVLLRIVVVLAVITAVILVFDFRLEVIMAAVAALALIVVAENVREVSGR